MQEERERKRKKGDSPAIGAGLCRSAEERSGGLVEGMLQQMSVWRIKMT